MFNANKASRGQVRNRTIIIIFIIFIAVTAIAKRAVDFKDYLNAKDQIIVIEGESLTESNFIDTKNLIVKNKSFIGNAAIELSTKKEKEGGYYVTYYFDIPKDGEYNIILAGTPPGPAEKGSQWHSPYTIMVDDVNRRDMTEELIIAEWPQYYRYSYLEGGYFFTKIITLELAKGRHSIKFIIDKRRKYEDGNFTFYVDAIVISPKGFSPRTDIGKLPKKLFYEF